MDESTRAEIGQALGRIPSGLFIVTSRTDHAEGMLGSWVMQASFDPPQVTVAISKDRGLRGLVDESGHFALSILGKDDGGLMSPFFKAPEEGEDIFAPLNSEDRSEAGGAPVLLDGHAWLSCKVVGQMEAGDAIVYLGEVLDGKLLKEDDPKVHVRKDGFKW